MAEENKKNEVANEMPTHNTEVIDKGLTVVERIVGMISKYGPFKLLLGGIFFVFFSYMAYIAVNPAMMFERYDNYIAQKHQESNDYRMESAPIISSYLNQLALTLGADRAYIIEYHNGKNNHSGLQWQYGDMTFLNDTSEDISVEFQNISLVRYPIFYTLYENDYWAGTRAELAEIDKRFSLRVEINEVEYIAFSALYGKNLEEIGLLGVSFLNTDNIDISKIERTLAKYATSISPLLDGGNVK